MNDKKLADTLLSTLLKEKRIDRRISIAKLAFFALSFAAIVFFNLRNSNHSGIDESKPYVATVHITGEIVSGRSSEAMNIIPHIEAAFKDKKAAGIALIINSPGGSPVQAEAIHDRLLSLRKSHPDTKIITIGQDMLTSGAYMVAVGTPKIYAADSSLVGSVGVVIRAYGFVGLINKAGIERRVLHAGANKNRLDPFLPLQDADKKKMDDLLTQTHTMFKDRVAASRKGRLDQSKDLFTGDIWNGAEALELGLIDGIGDYSSVLDKEFGTTQMKQYGRPKTPLEVITGRSISEVVGNISGELLERGVNGLEYR